jgi:hypothetical protein
MGREMGPTGKSSEPEPPRNFDPLPILNTAAINNEIIVPTMPLRFYDLPDSALALFSTRNSTRPKRALKAPYPVRTIRDTPHVDISQRESLLRLDFPTIVRSVVAPKKWEDVWQYFDAYDLWIDGPQFCFYVLAHMAKTNALYHTQFTNEIEHWAVNWVYYNKQKVLTYPPKADLVVLFEAEEAESLLSMTPEEIRWLRICLDRQRGFLQASQRTRSAPQLYPVQDHFPAINDRIVALATPIIKKLVPSEF